MERELMIRRVLKKCNIYPDLNAYEYLVRLIDKASNDKLPEIYCKYGEIGKEFGVENTSVERAARYCIEQIFKEPNDFVKDIFENNLKRPTVSRFVYTMAEYVLIMEKSAKPIDMLKEGWCDMCLGVFHNCYNDGVCAGFERATLNKIKKGPKNENTL